MEKYKQNLRVENNKVFSYNTLVATIEGDTITRVDWNIGGMTSSRTTSKHVNYVARELNLTFNN